MLIHVAAADAEYNYVNVSARAGAGNFAINQIIRSSITDENYYPARNKL